MRIFGTIIKCALLALCIVIPIRMFVAQPFLVSGESMKTTFEKGEYLVIDELTYHREAPQRGDVVIFHYPLDTDVIFVKRIIGLPGETVEIDGGTVTISAGGERRVLDEPYLSSRGEARSPTSITLQGGEYFVMGDNRDASTDSRVWGPLQERYLIGRAFARLFPFDRVSLFPGKHNY